MANEVKTPIPARIYNAAVGGHVAGADQIIDDETGLTLDKVAGGALEEKEYTLGSDNGMGRVVLRKNLVEGVNTLTQSMINKISTRYIIQYDFNIESTPENISLNFVSSNVSGIMTPEKAELDAATAAYNADPTQANLERKQKAQAAYEAIGSQDYYYWTSYTIPAQHCLHLTGRAFRLNDSKNAQVATEYNQGIIYAPSNESLTVYIGNLAGQYSYLKDGYVRVPANCVLEFDGGSLLGVCTVTGTNTGIQAGLVKIFNTDVTLAGSWNVAEAYPEWFGAKQNTESALAIQFAINFGTNAKDKIVFNNDYIINTPLEIKKTCVIDGKNHSLSTTNSSLTKYIFIKDRGATMATYGECNYVQVSNITFNNNYVSSAYGLVFENSSITGIKLSNINFVNFTNPCIYLISTGGGYSDQGVYAHNIYWKHIFTSGCSSIVGQEKDSSNSNNPYIYGGVIEDVHFEGIHKVDNNEYIMDLTKFRNIQLSNLIIEGHMDKESVNANPTKRKKGVIRLTHPCDIDAIYFEVKQHDPSGSYPNINALPINSLCAEFTATTEMNISNIYGDAPSPFILKNVKLIMQFATPSSLYSKFYGNLVDDSSENYKLVFVNGYYGGNLKTYGGNYDYFNPLNNNLPNNVFNKSVIAVNNGPIIDFDDTPPYIDIDLHEVKDIQDYSDTNKYKNILGIWNATISEKSTIAYTTDLKWGNTLKLTSTRADMLMRSGIQILHNGLGLSVGSWATLVLTLKADVKPSETEYNKYYFRSTGGNVPSLIYGNRVKAQDSPFTIICAFKITSGGYELFQIDSPHDDGDKVVDINQEYTILDLAIFKGLHYGRCRTKFFTEP